MNIQSMLLHAGLTVDQAIIAMSAISAFGCVLGVLAALTPPASVEDRARRINKRRAELKAGLKAKRTHALRNATALNAMQTFVRRLNLLRNQAAEKFNKKLMRAGWRSKDALVVFIFAKICMPFVFGVGAFLAINVLGLFKLPEPLGTLAPLGAVILGGYAPDIMIKNAIQKREKLQQKGLPDALDLMVICAEAGLSLDAGLTRVSREMRGACPEIADELELTAVELGFLPERRKALENLTERCQLPSIRGVVNTLLQTEKYGTPLANALRVLSQEYRNERMMKAEEKAARLPAIMTVPMMVFILPTLFVVLVGPAALNIIDSFRQF